MQLSEVIDHFVTKEGSYLDDKCRIDNGKFYYLGNLFAIRTENSFLISSNMTQEFSDSMIYALAKVGAKFERLDLNSLTNYGRRIDDLDQGRIDKFKSIADMYGMEYTEEEINSLSVAKEFRNRIKTFFERVNEMEAEEKRKAEKAAQDDITRQATEDWDAGKIGPTNSRVSGSGGGIRLRAQQSGTKTYVYTSQGEMTTLGVVKKAWNYACQFWYGGKKIPYGSASKQISSGSYYNSGRSATVKADSIAIGCQTVKKTEAERFAALMGWNKEGTN